MTMSERLFIALLGVAIGVEATLYWTNDLHPMIKKYFSRPRCKVCHKRMVKSALDTGDGWALFWDCPDCESDPEIEIEWSFGDRFMSGNDLRKEGYEIV
jgi:hypothetical protein